VVEIATEAATGTLRLRLSPAFDALGQEIRERTAERWLNEAAALGYDNLELSGADGRPLGRNALVGSGMILLDSAAK
jgi:hypothetical protein